MKKEFIIVAVMLIAAAMVMAVMHFTTGGTKVVVTVSGTEYGTYSLYRNIEVEIKTEHGTNILRIENGQADIVSATCPDKICVNTHSISDDVPGVIVCLPHEVIVEIKED